MSAWERKRESEAERRSARRASRRSKAVLTWDSVPVDMVGLFVHLMVREGRAILLGVTSDGDVLSIKVYEDGDKEAYYIRSNSDVKEELADILDEYTHSSVQPFLDAFTPRPSADPTPSLKSVEKPAK